MFIYFFFSTLCFKKYIYSILKSLDLKTVIYDYLQGNGSSNPFGTMTPFSSPSQFLTIDPVRGVLPTLYVLEMSGRSVLLYKVNEVHKEKNFMKYQHEKNFLCFSFPRQEVL